MRIAIVAQAGLPLEKSKAAWQRGFALSEAYDVVLVTSNRDIPAGLPNITVARPGWIPDRRRGMVVRVILKFAFALALVRFDVMQRLQGTDVDAYYTLYAYDLPLGAMMTLLGRKWILDVIDLPELLLDDVERRHRRAHMVKGLLLRGLVKVGRAFAGRASVVFAANPTSAEVMSERYGVPPSRLIVVPNGIDDNLLVRRAPEAASRGRFRIIYVGPLSEFRGTPTLIEALTELRRHCDAELCLVGASDPAYLSELRAVIELRGLGDAVRITGRLRHDLVIDEIDRADVAVCPLPDRSTVRGVTPIKLGEYMARGKAIVASDLPGIRLRVRHGESALLVPPGDVAGWVAALRALAEDVKLRQDLGARALRAAEGSRWSRMNKVVVERVQSV